MMHIKRFIFAGLIATVMPMGALAAGIGFPLDRAPVDFENKASLQRGAQTFMNYCLGCHSADYHRYNRMAIDLDLTEDQVRENLIFTTDASGEPTKVGSLIENNMPDEYAKQVFGVVPPNLTLIAKSRGADWLYTYLRTFYLDSSRETVGVNNKVFPDVGMPHVLWELQGWQKPIYEKATDSHGEEHKQFVGFEQVTEGKLSPKEYDKLVGDLVNFLAYLSDPYNLQRERTGMWVLAFLVLLAIFAYILKKEYWRDVH